MWPFHVLLWNGLCTLEFSLKLTPSVHKRFGKLMVSMECDSLIPASFTQETRSWLWPMLPRWRPALARYEASPRRTQRTLSKSSARSFHRYSFLFLKKKKRKSFHPSKHLCPLYRFHTWVFVPVRKWGRPGCGSWSTHPSCLWHTGPITASAGGRCSCRTDGSDRTYIFRHPPPPNCWLFILTHTAVLHQKKGALVKDKHADIFVLITARTLQDLCGRRPKNHPPPRAHVQQETAVVGFYVFVKTSVSMRPAHTLWQRWRPETATPQKYFSTCSCDPPGKDKHNSMIRFILVNVISSWQ